jgi:cation diffusion facilitator CzcD-associated flavoprotein CzcO
MENPQMTSDNRLSPTPPALALPEVVDGWLRDFADAVNRRHPAGVSSLFLADGWWRDLLSMTWDFRTLHGEDAIEELIDRLPDEQRYTVLRRSHASLPRLLAEDPHAEEPDPETIQAIVDFETNQGAGRGLLRLRRGQGNAWKAWTFFTGLQTIHGREQARGALRPVKVPEPATLPEGSDGNWLDWRRRTREFSDAQPQVLIVGAGQCGLAVAANLGLSGISTLVIEKNARVGDNWRNRYRSLILHDPIWADHLPYMPFPDSWPVRTPKDKLGDWLELYATAMDLNVWTGAELIASSYDDAANRWTVRARQTDGVERTLHPAHIVLATGVHGEPFVPEFIGVDSFTGNTIHSSQYTDGFGRAGQRAIIVGAGNSAHDIAEDLYKNGVAVTMVQRSSTYVMSQDKGLAVQFGALYSEDGPPVEDADLMLTSSPLPLSLERAVRQTRRIAELDRELLAGLERVGYSLDSGINGGGQLSKAFSARGPGGYYLDVGCCQLIIDAKVSVVQTEVERLTRTGVVFADGRTMDADLIVFATGYKNMRETARRLLGDEVASRCKPVWGLDDEGEVSSMWRGSGHPGVWFMGGPLYAARVYSRYLALQIAAAVDGLLPDAVAASVPATEAT